MADTIEDPHTPRRVASWYMPAAIVSALFMAVGCGGYLLDVTTDPATLEPGMRQMVEARPWWNAAAYAIAVWMGLAGAVRLILRRKLAEPLLLVSLVACVLTFLPYAVIPAIRDNITGNDAAVALVIIAVTWTIYWFARHSRQRGWLR